MGSYLRCIAGQYEGRSLPLRIDQPMELPLKNRGKVEGLLRISASVDGWLLTREGIVPVAINGTDRSSGVLDHGDLVKVGKMTFEVHLDDPLEDPAQITELPAHHPGKGDTVMIRMAPRPSGGDEAERHQRRERSGARSRRRLSAARSTSVAPTPPRREGIIKKVSQVLRREGSKRGELDVLINERDELLRDAGRLALEQVGGFGLPEEFLRHLGDGETVSLQLDDLATGDLDAYRQRSQHLQHLDAEIEAMRQSLDMDPGYGESDATNDPDQRHQAAQHRAHQAMDGVGTEEFDPDEELLAETDEDEDEDGPAPVAEYAAEVRRPRRRRRR